MGTVAAAAAAAAGATRGRRQAAGVAWPANAAGQPAGVAWPADAAAALQLQTCRQCDALLPSCATTCSMATLHHQPCSRSRQAFCNNYGKPETCFGVALARWPAASGAGDFDVSAGRRRRRHISAACQGCSQAGVTALAACHHRAAASGGWRPCGRRRRCARCRAPARGCGCARDRAAPAAATGTSANDAVAGSQYSAESVKAAQCAGVLKALVLIGRRQGLLRSSQGNQKRWPKCSGACLLLAPEGFRAQGLGSPGARGPAGGSARGATGRAWPGAAAAGGPAPRPTAG